MNYKVKTAVFEGPLDLLLSLIEKRKLFINEISLAQVTDDYMEYVKNLPKHKLSNLTSFILLAATLVLIKSKSLISNIELTEEEEDKIEDLERRLKMYKSVREASLHIKDSFGKNNIFVRVGEGVEPVFTPDSQISVQNSINIMREILESLPEKDFIPEVEVERVVNIEEIIDSLHNRIQNGLKSSFNEFSNASDKKGREQKVHIIVSFLAMLELVRQGLLEATQGSEFEDIEMEKI